MSVKKLSLYIFLVLIFYNVANAKDFKGTKLLCSFDYEGDVGIVSYGLEFITSKKAKEYSEGDWEVSIRKLKYHVKPDRIDLEEGRDFGESVLWRESLQYVPYGLIDHNYDCQMKIEEFSFQDYFQNRFLKIS